MTPNKFQLVRFEVLPVRWPLLRPFVTALGSKSYSDNVIVKAHLSGGTVGYGEASSSLAMAFQTQAKMAACLRRLGRRFRGADVRDKEKIVRTAWRLEGEMPTAVAAFECALWDAFARAEGVPFYKLWGGQSRRFRTLLTISCVSPEDTCELSRQAARKGFNVLKLKINGGESLELSRDRIRALRRGAPRALVLLDANQSCSRETLALLIKNATDDGIRVELVEEPFRKRDWKTLAAFRGRLKIPLLLDESIQNSTDARRVVSGRLAQGVNVKLAKSGLARGEEIVKVFQRNSGEKALFMIGCMAESPIGLSAAAHFAGGLGVFDYADLDSDLLLKSVRCKSGYLRKGPEIVLSNAQVPGLGVEWPV